MPPRNAGGGPSKTSTAGIIQIKPPPAPAKTTSRLKVIVRRLPPSLTVSEFEQALGDEWSIGAGKVDWAEYRQGKIRSPGKLPEQSRVYLRLTSEAHIRDLESKFLSVVFHDAKGTHRHQDLKHLPPVLEFAPFQRTPPAKSRLDNRQGLIDQDPEYMAFLEGETQATPKPQSVNALASDRIKVVVTSTPLILALRQKKAARAKKASSKKTDDDAGAKGKAAKLNASKSDTKTKDAAKLAAKGAKPAPTDKDATAANASAKSKRERPTQNIRSLLERDLGLSQSKKRSAKAEASEAVSETASTASTNNAQSRAGGRKSKGDKDQQQMSKTLSPDKPREVADGQSKGTKPKALPSETIASTNGNGPNVATRQPKTASKPNPNPNKAFIKRAQGISEEALRESLSSFGDVITLDFDKRKNCAVAGFKTNEALVAVLAKRTVSVGEGSVEVVEYKAPGGSKKEGDGASPRGNRGRGPRGGGAGGSGGGKKAPKPSTGAG